MGASISVSTTRPSANHVNSLDGFRGLAFLLVFVRHYSLTSHSGSRMMLGLMTAGQGGWIGVDLFFALSGFLITGILIDTREQNGYFKKFFARRALRIFPLYYGVFLLLFALTPVLHLQWHTGHIAYLLYAGNIAYCLNSTLSVVKPDVLILHLWSLAVEEQFYLVWPLVIFLVGGSRQRLVTLCFSLSALAFVLRVALVALLPEQRAYEWSYAMLPTHMDGLLYGALGALWVRSRPIALIQPAAQRLSLAAAAVIGGIYCVAGFNFSSRLMILLGFPALGICFAAVLLQALQPGSWASRLGSLRFLRFLGKYSYGLYMFHILFAPGLAKYQGVLQRATHSVLLGGLAYTSLVFLGTCLAAVLSFQIYEKHWLRLKKYFAYQRTVTASTAQVAAS